MNLLNFKHFMTSGKHKAEQAVTRQERKENARTAKAERLKRRLTGHALTPFLGPGIGEKLSQSNIKTRQTMRLKLRVEAFEELTRKYSGESRKLRRAMARDLAKRRWREIRGVSNESIK